MAKSSPVPFMLAAGFVLAVSSGKTAPPKLAPAPAPKPAPGGSSSGGGAPMSAPTPAPTIPESAQCSFNLELYDASGDLLEVDGVSSERVHNGLKSDSKEAESIARSSELSGPTGSRWVLVGVCDVGGELKRYQAAVIKTFVEDE